VGIGVFAVGALWGSSSSAAGSTTPATRAATVKVPSSALLTPGKLIFCSDITYPPEEFIQNGKQVGAEVEIGHALAKQLGLSGEFDQTGFNAIIPALNGKKCDAILSGMGISAERAKAVTFVPYVIAGQSIMIHASKKGTITGLGSLSGKLVAVETGTTNLAFLQAQNKTFASQGKKQMQIITFPTDPDAAEALVTNKVDAYFSDTPPVDYYVKLSHGSLLVAGPQLAAVKWGIAVRKNDPQLAAAIRKGVGKLYSNGTMKAILTKWNLASTLLSH
jgi:polar amino acid transport system substrate-binding protein